MKKLLYLLLLSLTFTTARGQDPFQVRGNFSVDAQYYREDSAIAAVVPDEQIALQGFGNIILTRGKFETGVRFETYLPAFVGYPAGAPWDGTGIGYRYAKYNGDRLEITVGNFYEQFGSGLVLRTWEDRGLGVDYALDGIRVVARPIDGITIKGLYGRQRFNFDDGFQNGNGIVRGADVEFNLNQLLDSVIDLKGQWTLGGSFVSKYEQNRNPVYDFPENVGAGSVRLNYQRGGVQLGGEYAYISTNPSSLNSNIVDIPDSLDPSVGIFQYGQGLQLNANYSRRGFGIGAVVSSISNMALQSQRNSGPFDSWINYLPPTSVLQTTLLAQFYPYATQPNGEVAIRGDLFYNIPKNSALGGKYGAKLEVSYTHIQAPDFPEVDDFAANREGIKPTLFTWGDDTYYADFNAKITKKISRKFKASLLYMNIVYDNDVVLGAYDYSNNPTKGVVYADLVSFEGSWRIKRGHNLRFELQGLFTDQHLQDWFAVVTEYTVSPHWFFSVVNQYNYGNADGDDFNFPVVSTGYISGSNRISVTYGRQRAGVFCVGGVCRVVPASNGLTISLTSSF
jgi:hypothetical protein